jgi:hypothetical protein
VYSDFNDCSYDGVQDSLFMEKRRGIRGTLPVEASIYPETSEEAQSDEVELLSVNLSRHGIGMDLPHEVAIDTVYNLAINIGHETLRSHVRITSCAPVADGLYRAGGELCA